LHRPVAVPWVGAAASLNVGHGMSAITIDDDLVHYEVLGRGRPVILLHGWLGSWRYWLPAMRHLSMKYRTYALDLWGFGDSGRNTARYNFEAQVALIGQFMERMGISKAALIGHDLGAAVAAQFAVKHPDRVPRLMTVCPPLFQVAPPGGSPDAGVSPSPAKDNGGQPPAQPAPHPPVHPEAETLPLRTDEMKARVRAELEKKARALGETRMEAGIAAVPRKTAETEPGEAGSPESAAKTPQEAAVPPTGLPTREIGTKSAEASSPPDAPQVPSPETQPAAAPESERPNPLREYLELTDRIELLKRHVEAGADRDKLTIEVEKTDPLAFSMALNAFAAVDTLADLRALAVPAVMVYSDKDTFTPAPGQHILKTLTDGRSTFGVMALANARHFPMLEDSAAFSRLLLAFLEASDVTSIELKDLWVRRVR